jgi:methylated-DNA-protein-cysteine methyltransferase-like protein
MYNTPFKIFIMLQDNCILTELQYQSVFGMVTLNSGSIVRFKGEDKRMTLFTEKVIAIICSIPEGKVMTYGQIASHAGSTRGARQVVRILHAMSKAYKLPWHRVVNVRGEISIADDDLFELQAFLLRAENVEIKRDRYINLGDYQFHPAADFMIE